MVVKMGSGSTHGGTGAAGGGIIAEIRFSCSRWYGCAIWCSRSTPQACPLRRIERLLQRQAHSSYP